MIDLRWVFAVNIFSIIILLILLISMQKTFPLRKKQNRLYYYMVLLGLLQPVFYTLGYVMKVNKYFHSLILGNIVSSSIFVVNAIFEVLLLLYILNRLYEHKSFSKKVTWFLSIPALVVVSMALVNLFTPVLFRIDPITFEYSRQKLFIYSALSPLFYFALAFTGSIYSAKLERQNILLPILIFVMPVSISLYIEASWYGVSVISLACAVSLSSLYINLAMQSSFVDSLSGLYSRGQLNYDIEQFTSSKDSTLYGALIDIDDFKYINDIYGHINGDSVIASFGKALKSSMKDNCYGYRFGGDEFIILSNKGKEELEEIIESLAVKINDKNEEMLYPFHLKFSYGIAGFNKADDTIDSFVHKMDEVMYENKKSHKLFKLDDRDQFYDFEELNKSLDLIYDSIDDYPFVYDVFDDVIQISPKAIKRFKVDFKRFKLSEYFADVIHKEDHNLLLDDLQELVEGKKTDHALKYRWMDRDGNPVWIFCRGSMVKDFSGKPRYLVGCISDIGSSSEADNTTGLLNYSTIRMANPKIADPKNFMAILFGIDNLQHIFRHFGYAYGLSVCRDVANAISSVASKNQKVVRFDNNQIILLDYENSSKELARNIVDEVRHILESKKEWDAKFYFGISASVIQGEENVEDIDDYILRLEKTLEDARSYGKNSIAFSDENDYTMQLETEDLLSSLKRSVESNFDGFEVYFQPIVDAKTEDLHGFEALLRYKINDKYYSPVKFVPLLEESELIIPVTDFIVKKSLEFSKKVNANSKEKLTVSVNLSFVQLIVKNNFNYVYDKIKNSNLDPSLFAFELTESGHIDNNPIVKENLSSLKSLGFKIAIDDFGTGYSNFINILEVKPNIIKIDRQFVAGCDKSKSKKEVLKQLIGISKAFGAINVIEGVETKDELEVIRKLGGNFIQGYYYSKPLPADEIIEKYKL